MKLFNENHSQWTTIIMGNSLFLSFQLAFSHLTLRPRLVVRNGNGFGPRNRTGSAQLHIICLVRLVESGNRNVNHFRVELFTVSFPSLISDPHTLWFAIPPSKEMVARWRRRIGHSRFMIFAWYPHLTKLSCSEVELLHSISGFAGSRSKG